MPLYSLALLLLLIVSIATHADEVIAFAGVVADQGKPVAGATVWLLGGTQESTGLDSANAILFQTTTDLQGQFRLPYCKDKSLAGILVRAVDGRMSEIKTFAATDDPLHLTCELPPGKEYRGKLVDQTGKPWSGAVIRTERVLGGARKRTELGQTYFTSYDQHVEVPRLLQQQFQVTTGTDGQFVLPGIPHPGLLNLKVTLKPGYEVHVQFDVERDKKIVVGQPGKLIVNFKGVDNPKELKESRWSLGSYLSDDSLERHLYCKKTVTHPGSSEWEISELAPGKGYFNHTFDRATPYILDNWYSEEFSIESGKTTFLTVAVKRGTKITGKVVDAETRKGMAGVTVKVFSIHPGAANGDDAWTSTQSDGTFSSYIRQGFKVRCGLNMPPLGYVGGHYLDKQPDDLTNGQTVWPDIELRRSVSLRGQVLDELGKPVVGAWIHTTQNYLHSRANTPMTDHEGRFQLNNLRPEVLEVYVRSTQAVSPELVKVNLDKPVSEVVLKVDRKAGVYLEGQLIDTLGKPLPHLSLELHVPLRDVPESSASRGLRFWLHPTDAQGRFRVGPFWPGQQYQLSSWIVSQQADFKSPVLVGKPGETLNFGKMFFFWNIEVICGCFDHSHHSVGASTSALRDTQSLSVVPPISTITIFPLKS